MKKRNTCALPDFYADHIDALSLELQDLGISYVGHGVVNHHGEHSGYFSDRNWRQIYMGNEFFYKEPILDVFSLKPYEPVCWEKIRGNPVAQLRQEKTGIVKGITFCSFHEEYFGFLNLGFSEDVDTSVFSKEKFDLLNLYHHQYDYIHLSWRKEQAKAVLGSF